jgi:hypothetical protein
VTVANAEGCTDIIDRCPTGSIDARQAAAFIDASPNVTGRCGHSIPRFESAMSRASRRLL